MLKNKLGKEIAVIFRQYPPTGPGRQKNLQFPAPVKHHDAFAKNPFLAAHCGCTKYFVAEILIADRQVKILAKQLSIRQALSVIHKLVPAPESFRSRNEIFCARSKNQGHREMYTLYKKSRKLASENRAKSPSNCI